MGPGSFDPGSDGQGRPDGPVQEGFNGAGVFRPRKSTGLRERRTHTAGFNGAGVFRPRKCLPFASAVTTLSRFNGAGVFRPRKCFALFRQPQRRCTLQWGRGLSTPEVPDPAPPPKAPERCFNGAGVFRPRKCSRFCRTTISALPLQWGRGLSTPEVPAGVLFSRSVIAASMGPGSFDPGSEA